MATTMEALSSPIIRHGEFIKLELPTQTLYFCNAAAPITVNGMTFTNLNTLLQLGDIQRDIKATNDDLTITLTGIDPANIALILSNNIKGSMIHVWRGFFDANNQIINWNIMKIKKVVSSVIYNGPSMLDGKPIIVVGIITSNNAKTGNMLQTHIIRSDINPVTASKTGGDYSICGDCVHKGTATNNPDKKTAIG